MDFTTEGSFALLPPREQHSAITTDYAESGIIYKDGSVGLGFGWGGGPFSIERSQRMEQRKAVVAKRTDLPSHPWLYVDNYVNHWKFHVKDGFVWSPSPVTYRYLNGDYKTIYPAEGHKLYLYSFIPSTSDPTAVLFPAPPEALLLELYEKALKTFTTQMPEAVEGFNFLAELSRLHELIPRAAASITATVASGFLNWNFGWAPFLSDLRSIANILGTVQKRLQHLRNTWGKKHRLSFVRKNFWGPPTIPYLWDIDPEPYHVVVERTGYQYDFRAQAWLTHHLEDLDSALTVFRALAVSLGFGNPLGAVWEALPFSFILDWLFGVDSVLSGLSITDIAEGDFWVRRPTSSVKMVGHLDIAQYTVRWPQLAPPLFDWVSPEFKGKATVSRYTRWSGPPGTRDWSDLIDGFSGKEASLLLAILAGTSY
jgi:hypothetical protein